MRASSRVLSDTLLKKRCCLISVSSVHKPLDPLSHRTLTLTPSWLQDINYRSTLKTGAAIHTGGGGRIGQRRRLQRGLHAASTHRSHLCGGARRRRKRGAVAWSARSAGAASFAEFDPFFCNLCAAAATGKLPPRHTAARACAFLITPHREKKRHIWLTQVRHFEPERPYAAGSCSAS